MNSQEALSQSARRAIVWVILERWGSRLVTLAVLTVLTRLVSPSDFGVIALAGTVVLVLQVLTDSGFSKALIQRRELFEEDATTAFWISFAISCVLAVVLCLCAPVIARAAGEASLSPVLRWLSFVLPLSALSQTPAALLERSMDFRRLSIRQLIATFVGALVALVMALSGLGVWALVGQTLSTALTGLIVLWASTSWRPQLQFSRASLRRLRAVGLVILGTDLLDALQANLDKVVIGIFFSAETLGYYFLAQRLGTIVIELVTSVISRVSFSTFSRAQGDPERVTRIFMKLVMLACAVSFPVFAVVAGFAPQVVNILFGSGWTASVQLIYILSAGWAFSTVMYFDRTVLLATGQVKVALWLSVLQNVVSIVLLFALLPYGAVGVALSRLARTVTLPLRLYILRTRVGVDVWRYLSQMFRCLVAASPILIVAFVANSFNETAGAPSGLVLFVGGSAGIALSFPLLLILAGTSFRSEVKSQMRVILSRRTS